MLKKLSGFEIYRSYRNPNRAELLANFDSTASTIPPSRPKTVPARSMHDPRQPHVPAPYFFKYYNKPLTSHTHTHKKTNSPITQYEGWYENEKSSYTFPKRQIFYSSKPKDFADDNFEFNDNGRKFPEREEKHCGKR